MPAPHLLNTDTVSYSPDDRNLVVRNRLRLVDPRAVFLSSVTVAQLLFGRRRFTAAHARAKAIDPLLATANILDWGVPAAEAGADIRHKVSVSGNLMGELDRMIAAQALAAGYTLVSNNTRHFPPLLLENWATPPMHP